jgi:non-ribosomal peptide synthetase component E (peptide arylation enzyme)
LPFNMASFFKPWVEKLPDKMNVILEDRRISYAEFDKLINRMANGFPELAIVGIPDELKG